MQEYKRKLRKILANEDKFRKAEKLCLDNLIPFEYGANVSLDEEVYSLFIDWLNTTKTQKLQLNDFIKNNDVKYIFKGKRDEIKLKLYL